MTFASQTLSVIVPNYNDADHINISLELLCEQSFLPMEVIVIDNCSTDDSINVIKQMIAKYPFIRLIQNEKNYGHSYSINKAAKQIKGDYLYISSANDLVGPDFFRKSMAMLAKYPTAGLCFTDFKIINVADNNVTVNRWRPLGGYYSPQELAEIARTTQTTFAAGPDTILRSDLLPVDQIYNSEIYVFSDWFLSKLIAFRYGCCYVAEPLITVRQINNSLADKVFKNRADFQQQCMKVIQFYAMPAYVDIVPLIIRSRSLRNIQLTMRTPTIMFETVYKIEKRNRHATKLFVHLINEYVCSICFPLSPIKQKCLSIAQAIKDMAISTYYYLKNLGDRAYAKFIHLYHHIR